MIEPYSKAEIDAVYLVVNEFKSVMAPNLVTKKILPVEIPEGGGEQIDYIYEQPPLRILERAAAALCRNVDLSRACSNPSRPIMPRA